MRICANPISALYGVTYLLYNIKGIEQTIQLVYAFSTTSRAESKRAGYKISRFVSRIIVVSRYKKANWHSAKRQKSQVRDTREKTGLVSHRDIIIASQRDIQYVGQLTSVNSLRPRTPMIYLWIGFRIAYGSFYALAYKFSSHKSMSDVRRHCIDDINQLFWIEFHTWLETSDILAHITVCGQCDSLMRFTKNVYYCYLQKISAGSDYPPLTLAHTL